MEESEDVDYDTTTTYNSNNGRRKENQRRGFSHYKPHKDRKRRTQNRRKKNVEDGLERENSIRKEVVSKRY